MAKVQLKLVEAQTGNLPPVCMRCGAPAEHLVTKEFTSYPQQTEFYVGSTRTFLDLIFQALFLLDAVQRWRGRRHWTVKVPLCNRHEQSWRRNDRLVKILVLGCLLVFVAFVGLLFAGPRFPGVEMALLLLLLVLPFVTILVSFLTSIWVAGTTPDSITLQGVAPKFVAALEEHRKHPAATVGRAVDLAPRTGW
ncbi:MAG: hypothetical protein JO112_12860 [Planctomycetes bacterium]|nr:hypothetical protein [Planctomycetota bacterium]